MATTRTGGCLCGAVRYALTTEATAVHICHCSMCRRQGGHAQAALDVPHEDFRWTKTDGLAWYRSSPGARRPFCRLCGSALGFEADGGPTVSPNVGSLDDGGAGLRVTGHIHAASKGAYCEIDDDLPKYDREAPSLDDT